MIRVFSYARFSTDLQNDKSNEDQHRVNRQYAALQPDWVIVREFSDAGISGASMMRPDFQTMVRAALAGECDVVLAEALDRYSRDLEHLSRFEKRLQFAGVRIWTVNYGEITTMHIGLLGTMSTLFLKDLSEKTSRGLRGLVERGRMAGGLSYPYRVVSRGEWEVVPEQKAIVIERIALPFANGVSPETIVKSLNRDGVPGPDGCAWSASTLHGEVSRGTGILNNELYVGVYVWPKQRYVKNPETGKRVARPVPDEERGRYPRRHLRIMDDDLWAAIKRRQSEKRRVMISGVGRGRKPAFLFSGLTKCGACGGGFIVHGRDELRYFNRTKRGTCSNTRMIRRPELEDRVNRALQECFLADREAFAEFCEGFTEELNRLRREHRAKLAAAPREIASINRRSKEIMELLLQGFRDEAWKEELRTLEQRRTELQATISNAQTDPPLPALHPHWAEVFRHCSSQRRSSMRTRSSASPHGRPYAASSTRS